MEIPCNEILTKSILEETKNVWRQYKPKEKKRKLEWAKSFWKNIMTLSSVERGRAAAKVIIRMCKACKIKAKYISDGTLGYDLLFEDKIRVELKYSAKGESEDREFQFNQIRLNGELYDYILFWFVRPDINDCLFYLVPKEKLIESKIYLLHRGAADSYSLPVTPVALEFFKQYGDGTLEDALKNLK